MLNLRFAPWLRAGAAALAATLVGTLAGACALESDVTPPELPPGACAADGNCDDGNPCTVDACGADKVCVVTPAPDGEAPTQIPSDCETLVCTAGVAAAMPNPADFADDGNSCTQDFCGTQGPAHAPAAPGTLCEVDGAAGTCDAGACVVDCMTSSDCATNNPCNVGSCDALTGACTFEQLSGHPELFTQTAGDCRTHLCVTGAEVAVVDDADVPTSATDCDQELCSGGVASNPPLAMGTACGPTSSDVCDGNGVCLQCVVVSDCDDIPASDLPLDSACGVRACDAATHQCVFQNSVPNGTEVNLAVGDCKMFVCQGGEVTTVADPADPNDDGNECTQDLCSGTSPSNPPLDGTACGMGLSCVTGSCICQSAAQCPAGSSAADPAPTCRTPICNAQGACGFTFAAAGTLVAGVQSAGDCKKWVCDGGGGVTQVNDDVDLPNDNNACSTDVCSNGVPSNPAATGLVCTMVVANDGVCSPAKACVQCNQASDCFDNFGTVCAAPTCSAGNVCQPNFLAPNQPATTQTVGDCKIVLCDGAGAALAPSTDNGDLPADDGNPCTDDTCAGGTPSHPNKPQFTACGGGNQCDTTGNCDKPNGASGCLVAGTDCASGFCTDGRCCESACNLPCRSCGNVTGTCQNLTSGADNSPLGACSSCKECGAGGVCNNVGDGLDPNNACAAQLASTCGLDGACDGGGSCRNWDATTTCAAQSCSGGVAINVVDLCNGSGTCVDGGTMDCGNYACVGAACASSCSTDAQCDGSVAFCNTGAGTCDLKKANGQLCGGASQCTSGVCADGVCCNVACSGCQACTAALKGAGSDGTCGAAASNTDPHNFCAPSACAAGAETGSVCVAGACGGSVSCAEYACNGSACRTSCTLQAHCLATGWCDTAVSQCKPDLAPLAPCTLPEQCPTNTCVASACP